MIKKKINFKLIRFDKLKSTNLKLKSLINKKKELNNLCISANYQTNGYGRRNTKWYSYKGNIHLSILIKPNCNIQKINQLSFATAISLGEILTNLSNKKIAYKWPNDILINKKKFAGIIIETSSNTKLNVKWAIIGIGINTKNYPKFKKIDFKATSLRKEGIFLENEFFLNLLINNFFNNYLDWKKNGFSKIKKKWLSSLYKKDNKIIIKFNNKKYKGTFINLCNDGSLKVKINKDIKKLSFGNQLI